MERAVIVVLPNARFVNYPLNIRPVFRTCHSYGRHQMNIQMLRLQWKQVNVNSNEGRPTTKHSMHLLICY